MLEAFIKDLKHALRMFAQSPAFTLAAVAALTLGIGANTAIFSVVNAVLLKPVAFPDPDRVVVFMNVSPRGSGPAASPAKFQHYREQTQVVQDVSAFNSGLVNLTGGSFPEQLRSENVSAGFFTLVGAPVAMGRTFSNDEDLPNGPRVVVLSQRLWVTRFDSDRNVIGKAVSLNGEPYTIVGVLGDFEFPEFGPSPQVWMPFQLNPDTADQGHYFQVAGRLKPGVTLDQAKARLQASAADFRAKFPNALSNNGFSVETVRNVLVANARTSLLILGGAVSFVLLIACANVANLLLARATGRRREIAIRAAIGTAQFDTAHGPDTGQPRQGRRQFAVLPALVMLEHALLLAFAPGGQVGRGSPEDGGCPLAPLGQCQHGNPENDAGVGVGPEVSGKPGNAQAADLKE